jgi:hypothetical protein
MIPKCMELCFVGFVLSFNLLNFKLLFVNEYQNGNDINKCVMSIIASFANKALAKTIPSIFQ